MLTGLRPLERITPHRIASTQPLNMSMRTVLGLSKGIQTPMQLRYAAAGVRAFHTGTLRCAGSMAHCLKGTH